MPKKLAPIEQTHEIMEYLEPDEVTIYLHPRQAKKFLQMKPFQCSFAQLTGKDETSHQYHVKLHTSAHKQLKAAIRNERGFRFTSGAIKHGFEKIGHAITGVVNTVEHSPVTKKIVHVATDIGKKALPVLKTVGKQVLPVLGKVGGVALADAIGQPELAPVLGVAGSTLGSAATHGWGLKEDWKKMSMKERMEKVRAAKKSKAKKVQVDYDSEKEEAKEEPMKKTRGRKRISGEGLQHPIAVLPRQRMANSDLIHGVIVREVGGCFGSQGYSLIT